MSLEITAQIRRGPHKGTLLVPHRYSDGKYRVSRTRFERDQVPVYLHEVPAWLDKKFGVRMSDPVTHRGPRLIAPGSVKITRS